MNGLLFVMVEAIEGLLPRAPSAAIRESLHTLASAAKDKTLDPAKTLAAWRFVSGDPYHAENLAAAVESLFPKGVPDEHKAPPPPPPPAPVPAEQPAEEQPAHHE